MDYHPVDGGSQLILDNRKIIIAFALLILICGIFFVIGFMEGKRQGTQRAAEKSAESPTTVVKTSSLPPGAKTDTMPPGVPGDGGVRDKLDWYSSVNKRADEGVKGLESPGPTKATAPAGGTATMRALPGAGPESASQESRPKPSTSVHATKTTYSVQVGAFRHRAEAEAKAEQLRSKRYTYVIETSGGADQQLFLLKVGKYESRADAVAMQNRLKKDGFSTFIKTSK